jgi:hypothetical protein
MKDACLPITASIEYDTTRKLSVALLRRRVVLSLSIDFFPGSGRIESNQFREISGPAQFGLASFSLLRNVLRNSFETRITQTKAIGLHERDIAYVGLHSSQVCLDQVADVEKPVTARTRTSVEPPT